MQAAINQTIDFLQNFQLQVQPKNENKLSVNENKGEISSDSKKSFSELVDDAKKQSEISEKSDNSEKNLQEKTEKLAAGESSESPLKNGEVKESISKEKIEKNVKFPDFKKENKTLSVIKESSEPVLNEKQKIGLDKNEKVSLKSLKNPAEKLESQNKIDSDSEKIKAKAPKKTDSEENSVKNEMKNENSSLMNAVSFMEFEADSLSEKEFAQKDDDFKTENIKSKGKTFSLDKEGKITVKDLRSEETEKTSGEKKLEIKEVKFDGKNNIEMDVEISNQNAVSNILSSDSQSASADGSNFQAMLQNQIQENADSFVKAGNIVLKDNNVGEIKLILHPEQLGNVKIDLQVKDNNISGRIIVQSQEAFEAFRQSVESLKQAFVSSGFETAGFDLSFAGQDNGQNQFAQNQDNASRQMRRSFAYEGVLSDEADFEIDEISENSYTNSVNIVA